MYILFPKNYPILKSISQSDTNFTGILLKQLKYKRLKSLFSLPTEFSFFIIIILPFLLYFLYKKKVNKTITTFTIVSVLITLILTKSFGAIVGLTFLLLALFIFYPMNKEIKEKAAVSLFFIIFSIGTLISYFRSGELMNLTPLKLRLIHWVVAIKEFFHSPFYGVGLGNFGPYSSFFIKPGDPQSKFVHNFFLQILAETGLIGIIIVAIILFYIYKLIKNLKKDYFDIAILSSVLVILSYNLIDIGIYFISIGILFSIVLGLIIKNGEKTVKAEKWQKYSLILILLLILPVFYSNYLSSKAKAFWYIDKENSFKLSKKASEIFPYNTVSKSIECNYYIYRMEKENLKKCSDELFSLDPISITSYKIKIVSEIMNKNYYEALSIIDFVKQNYKNTKYFESIEKKMENVK